MYTFDELLVRRRSIRNFSDKSVPEALLIDLIHDSVQAPSSGNEQPWRFVIVQNEDMLNAISTNCKQNLLKRIANNPNDYVSKYRSLLMKEGFNIFYQAPAVVYVLGDGSLKNSDINCTLAASYFMLSAANNNLGTCWVNFAKFITDELILNKMGITPEWKIVAPIAVGYPEKVPDSPARKAPIVTIVTP